MRSKTLRGLAMPVTVALALATVIVSGEQSGAPGSSGGQGQARADVLIAFRNTPGPSEQALVRAHGGSVKHSFKLVPAIAANIPAQAVAALQVNPQVTVIEPDGLVFAVDAFDTELAATWGVSRIISSPGGNLHSSGHLGNGVRVAVIDTGVAAHPDLYPVMGGWDFVNNDPNPADDNNHGTHVAGTIAALRNGAGVVGVAPEVQIYALKVLNASGSGSFSSVIAALDWVVNFNTSNSPRILVTNNSYGSSGDPGSIVKAAFDNAEAAGVLNVASAGNSGNCAGSGNTVGYPAQYASTLAVAATDSSNMRACFSSTGPEVGIAAPGVAITSTVASGGYASWNGTSMASPHVVGAAALVIAAGVVDLNGVKGVSDEVRSILTSTATDLGAAGPDAWYGWGLVNAAAAVDAVGTGTPPPPAGQITLTANGYKVKGLQKVNLTWTGATSNLDVYRNGVMVLSNTVNDGAQTDAINKKGSGTYSYQVCAAGAQAVCSNVAVVVF